MGTLVRVMFWVFVGGAGVWTRRVGDRHGFSFGHRDLPRVSPFVCRCWAVAGGYTANPPFFTTTCVRMWSWVGDHLTYMGTFFGDVEFVCGERGDRISVAHTCFHEEDLFR